MDRKEFFSHTFHLLKKKGVELLERTGIEKRLENVQRASKGSERKVRPPGALQNEGDFLARCTGCDACMAACPIHAIIIDDLDKRDPFLVPDDNPCIHCPGYPCVSACPTAALNKANGTRLHVIG